HLRTLCDGCDTRPPVREASPPLVRLLQATLEARRAARRGTIRASVRVSFVHCVPTYGARSRPMSEAKSNGIDDVAAGDRWRHGTRDSLASPPRSHPVRGDAGPATPDISVVLPCYRGARLAIASVAELEAELGRHPYTWEIIVVDDGGGDFP